MIVFFKPNLNDHTKAFVCDTVNAPIPKNIDNNPTSINKTVDFIYAHNAKNIPPIKEWVLDKHRANTEDLDAFLKKSKTRALIVIKNDTIIYEKYFNGGRENKNQIVFSVTKAFTATLTAIAIEEGFMHLDQKVSDFIPEFKNSPSNKITLRHLMNMVSGFKWNDYGNLIKLGLLYYSDNLKKFISNNLFQDYEPETHFVYKSITTQILGICLEKAIGKSYATYLEEKLWNPLGMKYDAYVTLDSKKNHNTRAFGGLALTAKDMAKFGQLLLKDGNWEGKQLIPLWFIKKLKNRTMNKWFGYSFSFWRNGHESTDFETNQNFYAAGLHGQYIFIAPEEKMVVVRTGLKEKNSWSIKLGRLTRQIGLGRTDFTDPSLNFGNQFEGDYYNNSGKKMSLILMPDKNKNNHRQWIWSRDKDFFHYANDVKHLTQMDGVSIGYKKQGEQTRLYFKIENNKVIGFYYNSWPSTQLDYFKKENNVQ
ncbi:MAG: beta-lactamase family protein [Saprospiraceae bacterium]|nr:beta-lactamase family protein [Saprospiraceae bacterium]